MDETRRLSFSIDGVLTLLQTIIEYFLAVFKPVMHFITGIAGQGWVGFSLVFMIFFMVFLVRTGAKTGRVQIYGNAMEYIGIRGMLVGGSYLILLLLEFLFMPLLVIIIAGLVNLVTSGEPGIGSFLLLMLTESPSRTAFVSDLGAFYSSDRLLLPLSFRPTGLIIIAFFCMWVVGKALNWRKETSAVGTSDGW